MLFAENVSQICMFQDSDIYEIEQVFFLPVRPDEGKLSKEVKTYIQGMSEVLILIINIF